MNMLGLAPKLTKAEWELIKWSIERRNKYTGPKVSEHDLLLWNREVILDLVHDYAAWPTPSIGYLPWEMKLLKKLGWDGVRRDG